MSDIEKVVVRCQDEESDCDREATRMFEVDSDYLLYKCDEHDVEDEEPRPLECEKCWHESERLYERQDGMFKTIEFVCSECWAGRGERKKEEIGDGGQ